jgi:RecA/RadA recombinase
MNRALLIFGPSGCGKSHLAGHLCERAQEVGGAQVLRWRCTPDLRAPDPIAGLAAPAETRWPALSPLSSVRVRIAFFERSGGNLQPEYEVGMRYWENGIADQLSMDFGDYVLAGKLTELSVPKPGC